MKMRINDILACFNKVLASKIEDSNTFTGHLVAHTSIKRLIGQIKKCSISIYYVNNKSNIKVCEHFIIDRFSEENKDSLIEKTSLEILTLFLSYWEDESFKKRIIENEYTNK